MKLTHPKDVEQHDLSRSPHYTVNARGEKVRGLKVVGTNRLFREKNNQPIVFGNNARKRAIRDAAKQTGSK